MGVDASNGISGGGIWGESSGIDGNPGKGQDWQCAVMFVIVSVYWVWCRREY